MANWPCGRTTVWVNCSRLRPMALRSSPVASWMFDETAAPSVSEGSDSFHSMMRGFSVVVPLPRFLARSWRGERRTRYRPRLVSTTSST